MTRIISSIGLFNYNLRTIVDTLQSLQPTPPPPFPQKKVINCSALLSTVKGCIRKEDRYNYSNKNNNKRKVSASATKVFFFFYK